MGICHAVLLDTVSIQEYIFHSNRLKHHIGASYLVSEIYYRDMKDALEQVFKGKIEIDLDAWETASPRPLLDGKIFEVGYIGGGNALLFFRERDDARTFITTWTTSLLVQTPGLTSAVACDEFSSDPADFQENRKRLFAQLERNKRRYAPETVIPAHGFTDECRDSGHSMDVWNPRGTADEVGYVSAGIAAKIEAARQSQENIHETYKDILGERFCFTDQTAELGQIHGEDSHMAIVHIDGNDMGQRFKEAKTLAEVRTLSVDVRDTVKQAFADLLEDLRANYDRLLKSVGFDPDSNEKQKQYPRGRFMLTEHSYAKLRAEDIPETRIEAVLQSMKHREYSCEEDFLYALRQCFDDIGPEEQLPYKTEFLKHVEKKDVLPVRPILLAGDDVTVVCGGKFGIYCAGLFLEYLGQRGKALNLTACAGVAVIKTKSPFSRGYKLAEQLCRNAKDVRRSSGSSHSYLDFHLATGGVTGPLQEIRQKYYQAPQGNLLFRPYSLETTLELTGKTLKKWDDELEKTLSRGKYTRLKETLLAPLQQSVQDREFPGYPDWAKAVEQAIGIEASRRYAAEILRHTDIRPEYSFYQLMKGSSVLKDFPRNKIYGLRQALTRSEAEGRQFALDLEHRGHALPEIPDRGKDRELFVSREQENVTPYFDMIELLELYPPCELHTEGGDA